MKTAAKGIPENFNEIVTRRRWELQILLDLQWSYVLINLSEVVKVFSQKYI